MQGRRSGGPAKEALLSWHRLYWLYDLLFSVGTDILTTYEAKDVCI